MAGTLTISTLSDGTNSTSSTNCIQGSAKAWVNWNGSGGATIRASYNVSSVTRNSTGTYTVNFTNAFADTSYATVAQLCPTDGLWSNCGDGVVVGGILSAPYTGTYSTTAVQMVCGNGSTARDYNQIAVAIYR